jgi:GNAT superfamily N-acetyltransferase
MTISFSPSIVFTDPSGALATIELPRDFLRLPPQQHLATELSAKRLDPTNVSAAIAVGRRAFIYKGEHDALTFEFQQFAKGVASYDDPVEKKPVTLVDYRLLRLRGIPAAVSGLYRFADTPERELSIGWTAVHPEFQKMGLGSAMLQLYITLARQYGANTLSVFSIEGDPYYVGASRLYTKGGFEKTDETVTLEFQLFGPTTVPVTWRKFQRSL